MLSEFFGGVLTKKLPNRHNKHKIIFAETIHLMSSVLNMCKETFVRQKRHGQSLIRVVKITASAQLTVKPCYCFRYGHIFPIDQKQFILCSPQGRQPDVIMKEYRASRFPCCADSFTYDPNATLVQHRHSVGQENISSRNSYQTRPRLCLNSVKLIAVTPTA